MTEVNKEDFKKIVGHMSDISEGENGYYTERPE
jgi:hypothetical protein